MRKPLFPTIHAVLCSLLPVGSRRASPAGRRLFALALSLPALASVVGAAVPAWLFSTSSASAQVFVLPRRPSQTNVRYADFDWRYADIMVGERIEIQPEWPAGPRFHAGAFRLPGLGTPWTYPNVTAAPLSYQRTDSDASPREARRRAHRGKTDRKPPSSGDDVTRELLSTAGGIRLYFYERERAIAERAAASIEDSYRYLVNAFGYAPRKTFAYFLYSSYIEFLQTDLFPLQEGVLGVTSTIGLQVTLPYFGDHRMFVDVSTHELAHEFTIQKVRSASDDAGLTDDPLQRFPLWFVEGLAEYYAKRGIDPEAEMLVRDLIVNPDLEEGNVMGDFFEDRLGSGLWTYKVGQVRCAFLEESYGKGTLQRILEQSPRLLRALDRGGITDFATLVATVVKDSKKRIAAEFQRWVKRRTYRDYLDTTQDLVEMTPLPRTEGRVQALSASPSGNLLMYRSIDPDTGRSSLYLADRRASGDEEEVAADGVPGIESLHPVAGRNFDVGNDSLAFVAERAGRDVIYYQTFTHCAESELCAEEGPRSAKICGWDVDFDFGERRRYDVGDKGLLTVESVAIAPDGQRLAFIGLNRRGQKDLYLLTPLDEDDYSLIPLTNDVFGERDVSWGPSGIVFTSDATGHGKYNVFLVDPDLPATVSRLTHAPVDQFDPENLSDGRVVFVAYDKAGANLYEATSRGVRRRSDVPTGLFDISPGPDGSIWALHHESLRRTPVRMDYQRLLDQPIDEGMDLQPPSAPSHRSLGVDSRYDVLSLRNWELGNLFLLAGVGGDTIVGELIATASDRLRDHSLIFNASIFGDFARTNIDLTYVNQEDRVIWGAGPFHAVSSRFDQTFEDRDDVTFISYRRYVGAGGVARYPLSRFLYGQVGLSAGGAEYFVTDEIAKRLRDPERNKAMRDLLTPWRARNDGFRFHTENVLSFGYNTIGLHRATGPIRGSSILLTNTVGSQPFDGVDYDQARLDVQQYFRLLGPVNFALRGAAGTTFGSRLAPQFYLSSFHTLRGVPFGDTDFLLGREFLFATAELQFPLVTFSRFPLIDLEGVLGSDFGGVGSGYDELWEHRVLDLVFGFNLGFGPLVMRLHFAEPIGIGVRQPNNGDLNPALSLNWRYQ